MGVSGQNCISKFLKCLKSFEVWRVLEEVEIYILGFNKVFFCVRLQYVIVILQEFGNLNGSFMYKVFWGCEEENLRCGCWMVKFG